MSDLKPIVCTLTDEERSSRTTTWKDVVANSVTHIEELGDGYALTLNAGQIDLDQLRNLVESESECCRWMNLQLQERSPLTLSISSASPGGKAVIKHMLGLPVHG
jgi:hypothetical protein